MYDCKSYPAALPRRAAVLGSLALVAGCVARPVAIDRASMAGVKQIALPTPGFPKSPDVAVLQGIGPQFGLIGIISTAVVRGNRSDALVALMRSKDFDARSVFENALADQLRAKRLTTVAVSASPTRRSFVDAYPAADADDAALDVYVSSYGFFAFTDSDDSPYRPGVSLSMRLVSARDRSVLMQDQVVNSGIDAPITTPSGSGVPPAFTSFSDVTANPDLAIQALRLSLTYAAQAVGSRLG